MTYITRFASSMRFSLACVTAAFTLTATNSALSATLNYLPQFEQTSRYSTIISANSDLADVYYPNPPGLHTSNYTFPVALLLQGALVDKSFYSDYASQVARYGFVVVVPNHFRPFPTNPSAPLSLLAETSEIEAVLSQMTIENTNPTSAIAGIVDTKRLGLLGHSFGAAVGLSAIANQCLKFLCQKPFTLPKELLAGAFYGANLRDQGTNKFIPIPNDKIGVELIQGDRDGVALPERAKRTFENIQTPPKALVTLRGANHFGITNVNNPAGALPDSIAPTLEQSVEVETIARWSGLFLRSSLLNDQSASDYIYSSGDALDPNVSVNSIAVPEPSSTTELLMFGALALGYHWHNRKVRATK